MIKWLRKKFSLLFNKGELKKDFPLAKVDSFDEHEEVGFFFTSISYLDSTPETQTVKPGEFIQVVFKGTPYWALFRCPCECGATISLSLQKVHKPRWTVEESKFGRPSVYPSVWQNKDCFSHFWITDGKVHWSNNSGIAPWLADPLKYSIP